jgi:hypothetical protein
MGLPIYKKNKCGNLFLAFNVVYPEDSNKINKYSDVFLKVFKKSAIEVEETCENVITIGQ